MTCIAEYLSWDSFTNEQKLSLSGLYVPYLALCKSSSSPSIVSEQVNGFVETLQQLQHEWRSEAIFRTQMH